MRSVALLLTLVYALAPAPVRVVWHGAEPRKQLAITFDAGADRGYAPQILQTLERERVTATFGMTGRWAQGNVDLVRRMARDGDQLLNHTYDHRSFTGLSTGAVGLGSAQRTWEINEADRVIRQITGRSSRPYFRPPYGDYDSATLSLLGRLGYRYMVMWTVDSLGWAHAPVASILGRCVAAMHPGTIVLMHVGSQSLDALALDALIRSARSRGYGFVTVAQLVARS